MGENRKIVNELLDFEDSKTIAIGVDALYVFTYGNPVTCIKYEKFEDNCSKTELASLFATQMLKFFSVANWANTKIVLTGGQDNSADPSEKAFAYDIDSGEWQSLPSMNIPRDSHSSTCIGDKLFVACGYISAFELLNSVEMINLGLAPESQEWSMITVEGVLTPRYEPVFSPLGSDQLLLIGGGSETGFEQSGVIIDTILNTVTAIEPQSKSKRGLMKLIMN